VAYSITSMATTLSNKAVINFYGFDYPLFLTMFQVCTATRLLLWFSTVAATLPMSD
jgi:hypothetical protein